MSRFDDRTSEFPDEDDDLDNLPYPAELPRQDFLVPDFDPQTYLSSLRNRHQTLQDLRSDLRQRSQLLSDELLQLVNGNYEEFLSLGSDLRGGEEKVEGVRVGLLAFQREVEGIQRAVQERASETGELLLEKKNLMRAIVMGRKLLEVESRIEELEESLGMTDKADEQAADDGDFDDADDEDVDEDEPVAENTVSSVAVRKLQRQAQQYLLIIRLVQQIGPDHPFLQAQKPRWEELRKTLLLDLAAALRQARTSKAPDGILSIIRLYGDLDAEGESVKVLKGG